MSNEDRIARFIVENDKLKRQIDDLKNQNAALRDLLNKIYQLVRSWAGE